MFFKNSVQCNPQLTFFLKIMSNVHNKILLHPQNRYFVLPPNIISLAFFMLFRTGLTIFIIYMYKYFNILKYGQILRKKKSTVPKSNNGI